MIPPLAWLCLRVLARRPALVPVDVRLNFDARHAHLLHALSPPLWAALVQVYDGLPADLHYLTVSLADPHLSLLQEIPHTPRFSLLTLLDLPACPHLNDTSVVHLRRLHSLVALDASATSLSSYAIKVLAGTLLWVDDGPQRRGPWSLRILRLRFCDKIDDSVYSHLAKFPLLTVIGSFLARIVRSVIHYFLDLRGTKCRPPTDEFKPSSRLDFFHPAPLAAAVDALEGANLYTSTNVFHLLINSLEPPKTADNDVMDKLHESTASQCSTRQPESDIISLESTPSMFYGQQPSRVPRPVKYDLVNDYRAVTYYKWAHLEVVARPPGFHDSELALYRTPPLWTTLEEHSTFLLNQMKARRSTTGEAVTHVASINRTERIFQINQGRIDALRESASARRRSMGAASSNTLESKQMPGVQGKNPFRRRSVSGAVGDLDRETKELIPI
ncbi:hypothetical protein C0993_004808 [Termitomyces sp. T159_Od127]|nr:hypothetical protein C0993_004808 [Termitomyces sp. T159_Od127]